MLYKQLPSSLYPVVMLGPSFYLRLSFPPAHPFPNHLRSPSLIANLLSAGLSIAQDMGLHKMPSDASFKSASSALPIGLKSKLLIEREIKKRVFWALVLTDWFSIPFRSSWVLGKVQIATEEPLNISDEFVLFFLFSSL